MFVMKFKTLKINEHLHTDIKKFCNEENLKMNKWCEDMLDGALKYATEYSKVKNVEKDISKLWK